MWARPNSVARDVGAAELCCTRCGRGRTLFGRSAAHASASSRRSVARCVPRQFLKYVLLAMGTVDAEDIEKALSMFDKLDDNRTGRIELRRARSELQLVRSFTAPRCAGVLPSAAALVRGGATSKPLAEPLLVQER
jgi:hypothetical protein